MFGFLLLIRKTNRVFHLIYLILGQIFPLVLTIHQKPSLHPAQKPETSKPTTQKLKTGTRPRSQKPEAGPAQLAAHPTPWALGNASKKKPCSRGCHKFSGSQGGRKLYITPTTDTKKSISAKEIIPWCACSSPAASSQVGNRPGSKQRAPSKDEHTENPVNSQCNPKWLPGTRTDTRYADGYTQPMDGTRLTDGTRFTSLGSNLNNDTRHLQYTRCKGEGSLLKKSQGSPAVGVMVIFLWRNN